MQQHSAWDSHLFSLWTSFSPIPTFFPPIICQSLHTPTPPFDCNTPAPPFDCNIPIPPSDCHKGKKLAAYSSLQSIHCPLPCHRPSSSVATIEIQPGRQRCSLVTRCHHKMSETLDKLETKPILLCSFQPQQDRPLPSFITSHLASKLCPPLHAKCVLFSLKTQMRSLQPLLSSFK